MDAYAQFVKKYAVAIDLYANVDVIPNPELTYRNQKYLEDKHGLRPVPVVHYKTDLTWLRKYMAEGYELIGLGGLVGSLSKPACREWLDRCFRLVCDQPPRLPKVKLHGFGVTNYYLMWRYPWWSVDSASWTKVGAFGGILVPHRRGGRWVYESVRPGDDPYVVKMSEDSPARSIFNRHYLTMPAAERKVIAAWLEEIGVPLGKSKPDGEIAEYGVLNRHSERKMANLFFFEGVRAAMPTWPWPFRAGVRRGSLGLLT